MNTFLNDFEIYLKQEKKASDNTLKNYKISIKQLLNFSNKEIMDLKREDFIEWIKDMNKNGLKSSTVNTKISAIQTLFNWLEEKKIRDNISKEPPRPPKERKHYETIPYEQINMVIEDSILRHQVAVLCGCDAGLRISETVNLKFEDINFYTGEMTIKSSKRNTTRVVPMTERLIEKLQQQIEENRIKNGNILNITANGIRDYLKKKYEKFGIKYGQDGGHVYHSLRHSFATELLDNKENPTVVADLLGDTVDTVLKVYSHSSRKSRKSAISSLNR